MRKLSSLFVIIFLGSLVIVSSCKKSTPEPEKSEEEKQIDALSKAWVVNSVTLDGTDVTDDWPGFEVTFGNKTYTTANSTNDGVWPNSGSYDFATSNGQPDVNTMLRSGKADPVEILLNVTTTSLGMTFDYDTSTNGRLKGTDGGWVFSMVAK
jgi:hypothetical protein